MVESETMILRSVNSVYKVIHGTCEIVNECSRKD